ncbi:MAG: caspase family protein [Proteobacteria bacterium]|nr:caspase family protein [Pseudomonadota bacterium]
MAHPIQHVVVLMLENRSFDHLLGALDQRIAGLDGVQAAQRYLADPAHHNCSQPGAPAVPLTRGAARSLDRKSLGEKADLDPFHEFVDVQRQLGRDLSAPVMNGFVANAYDRYQKVFNPATLERSISQVMRYFPDDTSAAGDIPALHGLATQFTVCDRWFSSIPGPTWPNRFFALAGTTRGNLRMPEGLAGIGPLLRHYGMPTIFNRFHDAGLRTRIYCYDVSLSLLLTQTWSIPDLRNPAERFAQDVAWCKPEDFPEFVFIEPRYFKLPLADKPNDQHPPHDIGLGDQLIADCYGALRANQALWQQTLFVVLYDEHGGFFDHVEPPKAVPPDDQVAPRGPDGDLGFGFDRLGVRVPAVLASPWLAAGVDSTVYDHSSLLAFLCNRWQLPPLGARCAAEMARNPFQDLFLPAPRLDTPPNLATRALGATRTLALDSTPPNGNQQAMTWMVQYLGEHLNIAESEAVSRALLPGAQLAADALRRALDKINDRLNTQAHAHAQALQAHGQAQAAQLLAARLPLAQAAAGAAPLRVWLVHGVGHGDDPAHAGWQKKWQAAFEASARQAGYAGGLEFRFARYDALFDDYPLDAFTVARALAVLGEGTLGVAPGRGARGLLDSIGQELRWTAGMALQWAENPRLRDALVAKLRQQYQDFRPQLVCAHSLGSLACYDLFRRMVAAEEVEPLNGCALLTFGSQVAHPALRQAFGGRIEPLYDPQGRGISQWFELYNPEDLVFTRPLPVSDARTHTVTEAFLDPPISHDGAVYLAQPRMASDILPGLLPMPATGRALQPRAPLPAPTRARRRALLVGINEYPKADMRLNGCVNDVYLMSAVLQECGFAADDIRVLTDERATRAALLERLDWLADGVGPDDERVFFYSGHGAQMPHYGADGQPDRSDETLVPVDFDWQPEHAFTDKEFQRYYSQLPYGANFLAIFDCCHAGGMSRGGQRVRGIDPPDDVRHRMLRWDAGHQMWVPRDFVEQAARTGRTFRADKAKQVPLPDATQLCRRGLGEAKGLWSADRESFDAAKSLLGHSGPYVPLLLFAAEESELAAEYDHGSTAYGAFTFALVKRLRASVKALSFQQLVLGVRQELKALGYHQTPTISGPRIKRDGKVPLARWARRR